jgi:hypothetical protein
MTDFAEFWALTKGWRGRYSNPRKGRGGAEPAWGRAMKDGADPEQIVLGARGYVAHIAQDDVEPQMVCMAATFLNQWRWEQYVEIAREAEEKAAADLLERRRAYYRYGWRDARNGTQLLTDITEPESQEAYDMGWRDALAKPKLEVVG